ncbi:MAG: threonylcarbamoyl-AMP synthase [Flavobacteriales bacterium]|nr:threonylcarbamoyl-AMP synthase [Flavobacteriales bacterium]
MLIEILPNSIDSRKIDAVVKALQNDAIIIIPTDTVYSFACDLYNKKALEKLARLKGLKLSKANFSLVCYDLSTLSEYTKPISRNVYKVMNKALPGAFTFILEASNKVPKLFDSNKKEIGIRIPNSQITREIVKQLGNPLAVTSVHDDDEILDYMTDPYEIYERFDQDVEFVIDGGYGTLEPSTIVSCLNDQVEIIREGLGDIDLVS